VFSTDFDFSMNPLQECVPMTEAPDILESTEAGVRTITLNRPQQLNSLTSGMLAQLNAALDRAAAGASVRCVVLAGAGRAFCAGQDLADPAVAPDLSPGASPKDLGAHIGSAYKPVVLRLRSMPVPTLAVVHGVAAGAGANVALGCDFVIAGKAASFIQAFAKIGLLPDSGGTWLLPRLVGRARALGLAMLGDKLSGEDAERMGLIWKCVDDALLAEAAGKIAKQLASMPSHALVTTRHAMDAAMTMDYEAAVSEEARLQGQLGSAHDYSEGVRAFMEKRAPHFKDRG
jgi:2-(1,2-epoxy-1,2-dihydrophenyl)acetyl-CoA isomerase